VIWDTPTTDRDKSYTISGAPRIAKGNVVIGVGNGSPWNQALRSPGRGKKRKVLMQAPKNGFFYLLDRATGELLSVNNYTEVSWASGIDMETGRPIETPGARNFEKGNAKQVQGISL
jgi:outer membrane protein assembly factor BamB|tara:strand:- start:145 stop:495 length:351 start_codon:yes stop_codon:yes gene_type:complete